MLVKEGTALERKTYEALVGNSLEPYAPKCYRAVDRGSHTLLYIEDLTAAYACPCVMDVKMGTRTFEEQVADNPAQRHDLMLKMQEVDPGALTADEVTNGVSKVRYMQFREEASSSASQGWRIEGIHLPTGKLKISKSLKEVRELQQTLRAFVRDEGSTARSLEHRLAELRQTLLASEWFFAHEIVSSSLLIIYDAATPALAPPGVWMIDFAHTTPLSNGRKLTHREAWSKGNQEEGYLIGLDRLISFFDDLANDLGA